MDQLTPFFQYMRLGEVKRLVYRFIDELNRKNAKSLAVLSLNPGEGKTFLVAVLAVGAAVFLKKKILVIDTTHQTHPEQFYLKRIFEETAASKYVDLIFPQFDGPSEIGVSDFQLQELIDSHQDKYDLVIFDTVAVSQSRPDSMDPIIVAKTAGSAVVVLSNKSISSGDFKTMNDQMKDWSISILGTIFNFGKSL